MKIIVPIEDSDTIQKVKLGMQAFKLSCRLNGAILTSKIPIDSFQDGYRLGTSDGPVIPEEKTLSKEDILQDCRNLQVLSLGALFVLLDEAFVSTLKQRNPKAKQHEFVAWSIIFQLRNAYAHTPLTPKWCIKKTYQNKYSLPLPSGSIELDFEKLNDTNFEIEQIGNFSTLFELFGLCLNILESKIH